MQVKKRGTGDADPSVDGKSVSIWLKAQIIWKVRGISEAMMWELGSSMMTWPCWVTTVRASVSLFIIIISISREAAMWPVPDRKSPALMMRSAKN